jgi:hypothetical protein
MTHDEIIQRLAGAFQNWLEVERDFLFEDTGQHASEEQVALALELAAGIWRTAKKGPAYRAAMKRALDKRWPASGMKLRKAR